MTPRAPVVAVEPGILDEDLASHFLSRSVAWLRAARQADLAATKRGEPPIGPAWIVIGKSIFYRPADLREWISARAVLRGKIEFDKRLPAPSAEPQP